MTHRTLAAAALAAAALALGAAPALAMHGAPARQAKLVRQSHLSKAARSSLRWEIHSTSV